MQPQRDLFGDTLSRVPPIIRVDFRGKGDVLLTKAADGSYCGTITGYGELRWPNKKSALAAIALLQSILPKAETAGRATRELHETIAAAITGTTAQLDETAQGAARRANKLVREPVEIHAGFTVINPKKLLGTPGWEFGTAPQWLNNVVPKMSAVEKLIYGWLIFRADGDGKFRKSLRSLASRDAGISFQHLRENLIPSLRHRGLIRLIPRGERVPAWIEFLDSPWMRLAGQGSCPGAGQLPLLEVGNRVAQTGQESCPGAGQLPLLEMGNYVAQTGQESCPHKEPITAEEQEHEHDHVHEPCGYSAVEDLQPAEQDLLNQIEELTERENRTEHYRTTWLIRIRERPNDVFKAIGQTRSDVREGKIKASIGGMLNWHFEQFRKASAKAARK